MDELAAEFLLRYLLQLLQTSVGFGQVDSMVVDISENRLSPSTRRVILESTLLSLLVEVLAREESSQ